MDKKMSINVLGAILMVVFLLLTFSPYWSLGSGEASISIQKYLWFPSDQKALVSSLTEQLGLAKSFDITTIVLAPLGTMVLCAIGVVVTCIKARSGWVPVFPAAAGLIGLVGYLSNDVFRLGFAWMLHMIICIALFVIGMYGIVCNLVAFIQEQAKEKERRALRGY